MKKLLEIKIDHISGLKYMEFRNTIRIHLKNYLRVLVRLHAWVLKENLHHNSFVSVVISEDRNKIQFEFGVLGDQGYPDPRFTAIRYVSTTIPKKEPKCQIAAKTAGTT